MIIWDRRVVVGAAAGVVAAALRALVFLPFMLAILVDQVAARILSLALALAVAITATMIVARAPREQPR